MSAQQRKRVIPKIRKYKLRGPKDRSGIIALRKMLAENERIRRIVKGKRA